MATYYVAGTGNDATGTGSTGNPWRSLGKAHTSANAGDTIIVRNGTYEEQLTISKANMTWRADTGHTPVVNGRYHIGLMSGGNTITKQSAMPRIDSSASFLPGGSNGKAGLVFITGNGVTLDGFVVQNSTGGGISIGASNVTVRNCTTYFTYSSGIMSNPDGKVSGLLVENNVVRFASVKIFDAARFTNYAGGCEVQCVDGSMKFGDNDGGTIIRGNDVAWGFGEGINIGKYNNATAANPIIVEGNVVHDVNHTYLYGNASRGYIVFRNNVCYCTNVEMNMWDGDAPVGIRLADEKTTYLKDFQVYNNLVVNLGYSLEWGGRCTVSTNTYVGHNTFVGGPQSRKPAVFVVRKEPREGRCTGEATSQKGILENNVIDYSMTSLAVANINNETGAGGVTFRNNNWSSQAPAAARGAGDVVGLPRLVKNDRALATTGYPTKASTTWASVAASDNFNIGDYQLTSSSPARGAGSNGTAASGTSVPGGTSEDHYGNSRDATPADRDLGAIEFGGTAPPTDDIHADFSFAPSSGDAPLTVAFTDESTGEGAAVPDAWDWDFGDGGTAATRNPSHEYMAAGVYDVTLVVSDAGLGISDGVTLGPITVTATPDPTVTADFTAVGAVGGGVSGAPPLTVNFVDLSGGAVATWLWGFGDGATSTAQNPSHTYELEGLFDVSLTVTDGGSATDTKTVVGYVGAALPAARRFVVPMVLVDVETPGQTSIAHYDMSDDADTGRAGYADVATNRARPVVRLTQREDEPAAAGGELQVWFDEDGRLKVKLPNGTVKVVDWT